MNTIIRLTYLEILKKKILYLTIAMTLVFLLLYGIVLHYAYDSLKRMEPIMRAALSGQFMSLGIYITGFITAFLSVFASVGSISGEIEQGTYDAVATKPIRRYELVLGRLIGIVMILLSYLTLLLGSVVVLNIIMGRGLVVNFSILSFVKALGVFYLLPLLLVAIGVFFSCSMSTMASGITVVILYFCAMIGGIVEQIGQLITTDAKVVMTNIGIITSLVMPSDTIYRKASALLFTTPSGLSMNLGEMIGGSVQPSNAMFVYVMLYITAAVILSIRKFNKRDL